MSIVIDKLPKNPMPEKLGMGIATLRQIIDRLPDTLPFKHNFWITGNLVLFGATVSPAVLACDCGEKVPPEVLVFFQEKLNGLVDVMVRPDWRRPHPYGALKLYEDGELMVDRKTLRYKKLPEPLDPKSWLTITEFTSKLPQEIPFPCTTLLSGSLTRFGITYHDIDLIIPDEDDFNRYSEEMTKFFNKIYRWPVDIGNKVMPDKEPVYLFKLYENGKLNPTIHKS